MIEKKSKRHTRIALSFSTDRVNGEYAGEHKAQFLTGISWAICRMARFQQQYTETERSTVLPDYTLMFKCCHALRFRRWLYDTESAKLIG